MGPLKVFISYRRADTQHVAGRLGDRIASRFTLFMDIDDIPLGVDFTTALNEAVNSSDVLVVLIGQRFFGTGPVVELPVGQPRDWVVAEVSAAFDRGLVVIPVLVDNAEMPEEKQLPEALWPLRRRQALRLSHASFNTDVEKLVDALGEIESTKQTPTPLRPAEPAPSRDALFRDPDYSKAVAAAYRKEWAEAVDLFTAVQRRFPTDGRVQTALADTKASDAETRGQWYEAVTALEALAAVRPGDRTIQNRLVSARREVEIGDLVGQLRALAAAEEWAGVVAMSQRIGELDPTRADPDGLAGTARAQLLARDLDNRYSFGLAELDRGNHRQAYEVFEAISRERPDYREVDDLLRMTRERLDPGHRPEPVAPVSLPAPSTRRDTADLDEPATSPLAASPRIWLVIAGVACMFPVIQGMIASELKVGALLLALAGTAGLVVLMLRDVRRLDRSAGRAILTAVLLAGLAGIGLVFLASRVPSVPYTYAHKYTLGEQHAWAASWFFGILIAPVPLAVMAAALLRQRLGPAGVWPALIFLASAVVTTLIVVPFVITLG